jgi:hypothetical protein
MNEANNPLSNLEESRTSRAGESPVIYLNPSSDEVYTWWKVGLCVWCGGKCPSDQCRARKCDSCTEVWLADSYADLNDGRVPKEDCPVCVKEVPVMHLQNTAPSFRYGDQ